MSVQLPPARRGSIAIALTVCAAGTVLAISLFVRTGAERYKRPSAIDWTNALPLLQFQQFESLGLAAYLLPAACLLFAAMLLRRPSTLLVARRIVGAAILIASATVVADRVGTDLGGPIVGGGGSIGASISLWLDTNTTPLASYFFLTLSFTLGLLLAAEAVVRAAWNATRLLIRLLCWGLEQLCLALAFAFKSTGEGLRFVQRKIAGMPAMAPATSVLTTMPASPAVPATPAAPNADIHQLARSAANPTAHRELPKISPSTLEDSGTSPPRPYDLPSLELLDKPTAQVVERHEQKLVDLATLLEKACADFGLTVKVVGIHTGPVVTQYEISLDVGMRVSKITSLSDDLALHLKVPSVRIIAPIPGKNTVGIEVPNEHRANVQLKELVEAAPGKVAKMKLPLFLGKDSEGRPLIYDLADMPHLLIAGRTGTGKSVCLNSIILSLLLTRRPDESKLIMIDPKQVELAEYAKLPHLMHPVVTDNKKAEAILSWAVDKMEDRYDILRRARVRNIAGYNELSHDEILRRVRPDTDDERQRVPAKMPHIVIVVDEVGDLMMQMKKEVEGHIIRLAQKSRAAGIHLILTTQRPTVDVITGLIKSNLPARICFQVADRSNSRVVLDEMGAEKLLSKGDMLFLQPNTSSIIRAQGTFASDDEIQRIVRPLEVENPAFDSELMQLESRMGPGRGGLMESIRKRDELYEEAIEIIIREGRGSVSLLQRALGIGYGRAARLIDFMAEDGIVGNYNSGQAREVLFSPSEWDELKRGGGESPLAESA